MTSPRVLGICTPTRFICSNTPRVFAFDEFGPLTIARTPALAGQGEVSREGCKFVGAPGGWPERC